MVVVILNLINTMPSLEQNKILRQFSILMSISILVLFVLFLPKIYNYSPPLWPWFITSVLIFFAIFYPSAIKPLYLVWMKFGILLGFIETRIILALIFYLLFLPTGLILRLLQKELIPKKFDLSKNSYRVKSKKRLKESMERPF